jgi:hypothetical protein
MIPRLRQRFVESPVVDPSSAEPACIPTYVDLEFIDISREGREGWGG